MATRKRDLRTGKPIWPQKRIKHTALAHDIKTDVLIVGSGISGAMVADLATEAGFDVVMVDRRKPMRGSTAASTALVLHEIDTPMIELTRKIGAEKAARAWLRSLNAVASLHARIKSLDIDCDAETRRSVYTAGNVLTAKDLRAECDLRQRAGIPSFYLSKGVLEERYSISKAAALESDGSFIVDPVKLTAGFLKAALERGMKLYAPAEIVGVESLKTVVKAHTKDGHVITCKYLIFCTGYEFPDYVPMKGHKIISTYVMATKPQKRKLWPKECLIWEASDPYLYLRATQDGRIIIGGEDEEFADEEKRDALLPAKTKILQQKLHKVFPDVNTEIDFAWTGSFGTSKTGLPSIGEIPGMKNCWALLGYGGNGITFSRIGAEIIVKALQNHKDRDADLFRF